MDPGVRERFLAWLSERVTANDFGFRISDCGLNEEIRNPQSEIRNQHVPTVVLVTHHVEEIVRGIQNTLILSAGHVHSAGPTPDVVTREAIETVYRTQVARIEQSGGRLWPIWG